MSLNLRLSRISVRDTLSLSLLVVIKRRQQRCHPLLACKLSQNKGWGNQPQDSDFKSLLLTSICNLQRKLLLLLFNKITFPNIDNMGHSWWSPLYFQACLNSQFISNSFCKWTSARGLDVIWHACLNVAWLYMDFTVEGGNCVQWGCWQSVFVHLCGQSVLPDN